MSVIEMCLIGSIESVLAYVLIFGAGVLLLWSKIPDDMWKG